ncbi:MAG: ABC transporter permease [Candidatus Heimdallarchaeaceae archaeon]
MESLANKFKKINNNINVLISQIKKVIIIQLNYPIDFVTQIFTAVFVGLWFVFLFQSLSSGNVSESSDFGAFMVWGLVAFFFYSTALWSIGRFVRREQLTGTLESIWITPNNKNWVIISNGVGEYFIFAAANLFIITAFSLFVKIPFNNLGMGIIILFLEFVQSIGYGLFYGALVFKIKNANAISNLVQFGSIIICAVFFPFSVFPDWMIWISRLHPFSWIVDSLRSNMMGKEPELINKGIWGLTALETEIVIQILINMALLAIGLLLFNRVKKKALVDGTLSHY